MTDHWIERLSDYIDGDLAPGERGEMEAHVAACPECAAALADLRRVVAAAGALENAPPERDLWPGIAERLGLPAGRVEVLPLEPRRTARRFAFTMPQLAAAAVAFLLLGAGGVWLARDGAAPTVAERPAAGEAGAPTVQVADFPGQAGYAEAVGDLERILEENRDRLDPATVRAVEQNLAIIDQAIEDTRRALAEDPADPYLNRHLAANMQHKVDVLRQATRAAI
ncbi:MAG TPA: zf-HC2 domain-containing protein [Gemmatimonadota bacterium]|nr:zf-HC2 domain-containing protein [Gemmatimonadota bacterium]